MATAKIRAATEASTSALCPELPLQSSLAVGQPYTISLVEASNLSPGLQTAIYGLFDTNMSALAKTSSFSYQEPAKRQELFEETTKFLLCLAGTTPSTVKGKEKETLLGYCSFRFDTEETLTSRDAEVIYCYELQLSAKIRGMGIGKILMELYESIGRRRKMDKGMLTCLKNNKVAMKFYKKLGYRPDQIDPSTMAEDEGEAEEHNDDDERVDYWILSKDLK
ncbi:hypothetical protein P7C73_g4463, partial [Tremellales sp. Uapishka_1]